MKTAISLPDPLFHAADQFAQANGLSRSELVARALQLYLQTHRNNDITRALDAAYAETSGALDPALLAAELRSLPREEW